MLEQLREQIQRHGSEHSSDKHPLIRLAVDWSAHSIETYSGELLKSALDVSVAIAEFANTFERINPETFKSECPETGT